MRAFVAQTDSAWFDFLSLQPGIDEVNFWMPNPWGGRFGVLNRGEPLLFKLKRERNAIAGGGFFEHYTELPISLAWEAFGIKNGAPSLEAVRERIARLRRERLQPWSDYTIGCILLVEPFFWPREMWIPNPPGFHPNIQRGRSYDLGTPDGRWIWDAVLERLRAMPAAPGRTGPPAAISGGFTDPVLQRRRIGQGTFRVVVTDAYGRRCAVTGEKALPALEAAHIRPFSVIQTHTVRNGLLLRSDVHRLFDAGYLTVTPEYRVEASSRMRDDFDDGDNYMRLHGSGILVPVQEEFRPDPDALRWHNENRFRG
ncbi:MAG TPA: HNH endonuclease [Longimicrobium sp.]|nr:HNH endonuclease [Longimicrobium sp.]